MKDARHYLVFILECISKVEKHRPANYGEFLEDELVRGAITYWLLALGDASDELPDELKLKHPEVPWHALYGFRNRAAHGYLGLDDGLTWDIVDRGLEPVRLATARLLIELGGLPGVPEEWLRGAE